jgi:hypothetical protein
VSVLSYNLWHTDVQVNLTKQQQIGYNLWQTDVKFDLMKQKQIGYNLWNTDLFIISESLDSVANLAKLANLANGSTCHSSNFWDFLWLAKLAFIKIGDICCTRQTHQHSPKAFLRKM